jgi:hypothetical protein
MDGFMLRHVGVQLAVPLSLLVALLVPVHLVGVRGSNSAAGAGSCTSATRTTGCPSRGGGNQSTVDRSAVGPHSCVRRRSSSNRCFRRLPISGFHVRPGALGADSAADSAKLSAGRRRRFAGTRACARGTRSSAAA